MQGPVQLSCTKLIAKVKLVMLQGFTDGTIKSCSFIWVLVWSVLYTLHCMQTCCITNVTQAFWDLILCDPSEVLFSFFLLFFLFFFFLCLCESHTNTKNMSDDPTWYWNPNIWNRVDWELSTSTAVGTTWCWWLLRLVSMVCYHVFLS